MALTETGEVWTWGEPWGEFSLKVDRSPRPVRGECGGEVWDEVPG